MTRKRRRCTISVGLLTVSDGQSGFKGNRARFQEWCQAGVGAGVQVTVIPHRSWLLPGPSVEGYQYEASGHRWKMVSVSRPRVLYNRVPRRSDEQMPEVQRLLRGLRKDKRVRLFNSRFFNKWQLLRWLTMAPWVRRYVPRSAQYVGGATDVADWVARFGKVYLKPENGHAGAGIMVAAWDAQRGGYRLHRQMRGRFVGKPGVLYADGKSLQVAVDRAVREERYVVQQGVELVRHDGRVFDLRVLLQKNRHGRWAVTGVGARVAGDAHSVTTHVPRGGSIGEPMALLRAALGRAEATALLRKLRRLAPRFARQIERASGDRLGELSLDVGVDTSGHLWLFEANAKPMTFDEPAIHARAIRTLFDYCRHLDDELRAARRHRRR